MKKTTLLKLLLLSLLFVSNFTAFSQNLVPFNTKYNATLKGDMLQIANGIVNRRTSTANENVPMNSSGNNNSFNMYYVDVDSDPTTFSSSSANLTIPVANSGCYRIRYAALYWSGSFNQTAVDNGSVVLANLNTVKFKTPGSTTYTDLTGTILYNSYPTPLSSDKAGYVASINVTSILQGLPDANGTYTVANVICQNGSSNLAAGWSLYVVYEDPLATAKYITLFDGFSAIQGTNTLNIPISGFTTIPVGPVRAKLAFSTTEGDLNITGDRMRINGTQMTIPSRPATNFFNSTINDINGLFTARNLNSSNNLGYDAGIINVPNAGNAVINNGDTSCTIRLETTGDAYYYFLNAFSIEVIQPSIDLIKTVKDMSDTNIGNGNVVLGQELYYDLDFRNRGNDNATNFTITDNLPVNVNFLPADLILPPGVTYTFSGLPANQLVFTIPNSLVTQGGANYRIRIKVRVVETCNELRDACSNDIRNQAFKTYSSQNSGNVVENQQPSSSGISACLIPDPGTTNFLVGVDGCTYERDEVLCGSNVVLTAGSGYLSYQWHSGSPPTSSNIINGATNQSYTATATGTYSVVNTAPAPCLTITETINVVDFNGVVPNPVIPFADEVVVCPNNGIELPKIYLCGTNDSQLIQTNILNATLVWEQLNEGTCPNTLNTNCPLNTAPNTCWTQVATGPTYNATTAGQYRVRVVFQNGCTRDYYFNVYQNLFTPTETHTDVICGTLGTITVNGVPANYEYQIVRSDGFTVGWQGSNVFTGLLAGTYTVYTRQVGGGVGNCLFTIPNVTIFEQNFTVDVIPTNALCNGGQGQIRVQVNNVSGYYIFELYQGATLLNSTTQPTVNDFTFVNLNPGTYTVNVTTEDGCTFTQDVTITQPPVLSVTAAITKPLTCEFGQITIYPVGGTPPYQYQVSTIPGFQSTPVFDIDTPGTYTITVTDFNNCVATTTITIDQIPPPVFTVSSTNVLCYGEDTGSITFNVTNSYGYTILYSIDNGGNFQSNPNFPGLIAGTYQTLIQYSLNGVICATTAQPIVISEPSTAVNASIGVSQLAGCGPAGEGQITISNAQGGVPGYQYSYDGGLTWVTNNQAYLQPGTYSICIRDTNLCTFCSDVTIDPVPQEPTVTFVGPDYNCDGTGNVTVNTDSNGGNYSYIYYLNGIQNTPPDNNVFTNIPCGNQNISIEYLNLDPPTTFNNLLFDDFGFGANTTSPGINSGFCWETQNPPSTCGNGIQINEGDYVVTRRINPIPNVWNDARDHTSNGTNPNGRFFCVNLGTQSPGRILYSRPINNIIPNIDVEVSIWAMTLLQLGNTGQEPNLTVELVRDLGLASQTIVSTMSTGAIPKTINTWSNHLFSLPPGNNSNLSFVIRSYSAIPANEGVAVVIDDIELYQVPLVCPITVTYPINIDCNQAFSAQITSFSNVTCNGANDGQITIEATNFPAAGFYYSLDGAPFVLQATSPLVLTGLNASTHTIIVQYDLSATPCAITLSQVLTQPDPLVVNATIFSPATCLTGATIQASATGGTLNYQYQLEDDLNNIIVAYQSSGTFSNIPPGNYIIRVIDSNGCTDTIDAILVVPVPQSPTATITSNLCIGASATFITVNASGGNPPYEYSLNGGIFQSNNTFTPLPAGTYNIIVRDSFGCTYTVPAIIIAPQLTANVVLASGLDCTSTPDAEINGTINGGTAPYTVQVSFNGGALTSTGISVSGATFTYTTNAAGNYVFTITDAAGCSTTTNQITVNPLPVLLPPTVTVLTNNICNGDTNGSISVTQNGGQGPYVINVYNNTTSTDYGTQTTGLAAGNYTVTVTDANSCTASTDVIITQPDPVYFEYIKTDIQCGGGGTLPGSILVTNVSGGTQPYTYTLSNTEGFVASYNTITNEDFAFTILQFGIYTITVVDANGCQLVQTNINMASPPNSLDIDITTATADCTTGGTIVVTVTPTVPVGPYYFAIYTGAPYPLFPNPAYQPADGGPGGLSSTFTGLIPGVTYSFIVYDSSTNCYYFETAPGPVPTNSGISVTTVPNNVTCTGAADGSVSFTFNGYSATTTSVTYQIYSALNNMPVGPSGTVATTSGPVIINNFGVLPPGTYFVLITENDGSVAGCSVASANFNILQSPVLLSLVANVTKNDNCNVNAGQITVTASNGTPAYTYQIVTAGGPAPTIATWAGQASNVFNVEGGNWDVYVKDAYNCIRMVTIFVPTDTNPAITLNLVASTLCNSVNGNYSIRVTRTSGLGIAPYTYSVDGGAFTSYTEDASNSFVLSGLASGLHAVNIRDANGCTFSQTITILPPLNGTGTATIAGTTNCGVSDGIITVNASGGSGNYSYSINPNPGGIITLSGNVFSNVPAGSYTVTITDTTTGCSFNIPVTIAAPAPVTFTPVATAVSCNGGTNGNITVTLGAGNTNPPYTYQITGPVNLTQTSNNVFVNLPAGNYTVTVTSGRGCSATQNVTVNQPAPIAVPAPTVTEFACTPPTNTNNNATITVTGVTGGSGTYSNYQFILGGVVQQSGPSNTYNTMNANGGTYTIIVRDNNGCTGSTTATIQPYIRLNTISVTKDVPITCVNDESITVNVTFTGGTPATLNYSVVGIAPNTYNVTQTSPSFTGLTVGNYNITVTNPVTGCSIQTVYYVLEPNTFDLTFSNTINTTCFNGSNGEINVTFVDLVPTPTNDAGPFTYTATNQNNGQVVSGTSIDAGPININGLSAGTYIIVATLTNPSGPQCTVTKTFTITQPTAQLMVNATSTPITCNATANDDGTITANAFDGWGAPYEYQLENGSVLYPWSTQFLFENLGAGTYTVRARDNRGCEVFTTVILTIPPALTGDITASTTAVLCLNDTTATITVNNVSGGSGNGYVYTLFNTATGTSSGPQSSNVFNNIGAGTYYVHITDSFNCEIDTNTLVITQPSNNVTASLTTSIRNTCQQDAQLLLTASGGTPPYEYSLTQTGGFMPLPVGGQTFIGQAGMSYEYYVRDANNCQTVVSNTVEVPVIEQLEVAITTPNAFINCNGFTTSFSASASGGLGNYQYTLQPATAFVTQSPDGTFNNVPAGTYTVYVTSGYVGQIPGDCEAVSLEIIIEQPDPFNEPVTSFTNVSCNNLNDGSISVLVTGGTGTIQYSIEPPILTATVNSGNFYNLAPGTYTVKAQDENGCDGGQFVFTIENPDQLNLSPYVAPNETCFNDGTTISFTVIGGTPHPSSGYTTTITYPDGTETTQTSVTGDFSFPNLLSGAYNIVITDGNGCIFSFEEILEPGIDIQPDPKTTYDCVSNMPSNSTLIEFNPALNLADLSFTLDGTITQVGNNIFTNLSPGNHEVVVTHIPTGCTASTDIFNVDLTTSPVITGGESGLNQFTVSTTGGSAPYTYTVNGVGYGSQTVYTITYTGVYTVVVTDANGCTDTIDIPMTFYDVLIPDFFTPNGDGNNDGWAPLYTDNYPNIISYVYDRYGRQVAKLRLGESWDGRYNNQELPTGDYWYVVKLNGDTDDREFVGHFTLYR